MKFKQPTKQNLTAWKNWLAGRPQCIRDVVEKYKLDPWTLYKLKSTNQRVTLLSISEPDKEGKVTCRVNVSGEFNLVAMERAVFGIAVEDLEECDLPQPGELRGSLGLSVEEAKSLLDKQKRNNN